MNMNGKINEKMKESTDTLCLTTYITILDVIDSNSDKKLKLLNNFVIIYKMHLIYLIEN